ncbi:AAC(3) family N-acetyltransferase [Clostridium estertheticum]|uniref:AAC(3) family N-acetyltransferase n=1 Tax=Clostridium estertheticum TaxID=238834 RepID=UPI001C0BD2F0|nr:AAC(3) family N-acetyltransferase [Clostridium estertheticum]MBU3174897.1 AAC(3) family N-acetyltransferase [Clostridium estertheticum]
MINEIVNKKDLLEGFNKLGIMPGTVLEVHSSLSSFGYVEGGALAVIDALKESVGIEGSIFMPALKFSLELPLTNRDKELGLTCKIKILNGNETRSAMGLIADTFRQMEDVAVGKDTISTAAWGKHKDEYLNGLNYVINTDGYALLLGVDIYKLTAMHYVEGLLPQDISDIFKPSKEVQKIYPSEQWLIETGKPPVKPWYTIQQMAYQKGYVKEIVIGKCKCMYFNVKEVVDLYANALRKDPYSLYGLRK